MTLIWFESVSDYAIRLILKIACASAADRFQFELDALRTDNTGKRCASHRRDA